MTQARVCPAAFKENSWSFTDFNQLVFFLLLSFLNLNFSDLLREPWNSAERPDPEPRWLDVLQIHHLYLQRGLLLDQPAHAALHSERDLDGQHARVLG